MILSWSITIHNSQGRTFKLAVNDLVTSEKCCGMSLVAPSHVKNLKNIFLKPFSYKQLRKINDSMQLHKFQIALTKHDRKFQATKENYHFLWNEQ